jgi:hypothetical protein
VQIADRRVIEPVLPDAGLKKTFAVFRQSALRRLRNGHYDAGKIPFAQATGFFHQ